MFKPKHKKIFYLFISIMDSSTPQKNGLTTFRQPTIESTTDTPHSQQDIQDRGYVCKNIPFEVGSRGHLTLENKSILTIIHKLCKTSFRKFCQNISKTSLLCSYAIYLSREDTWNNSTLLTPVKQWMWT